MATTDMWNCVYQPLLRGLKNFIAKFAPNVKFPIGIQPRPRARSSRRCVARGPWPFDFSSWLCAI